MLIGAFIDSSNGFGKFREVVGFDLLCPDDPLLTLDCIDEFLLTLQVYGAFLQFLEKGLLNPLTGPRRRLLVTVKFEIRYILFLLFLHPKLFFSLHQLRL